MFYIQLCFSVKNSTCFVCWFHKRMLSRTAQTFCLEILGTRSYDPCSYNTEYSSWQLYKEQIGVCFVCCWHQHRASGPAAVQTYRLTLYSQYINEVCPAVGDLISAMNGHRVQCCQPHHLDLLCLI